MHSGNCFWAVAEKVRIFLLKKKGNNLFENVADPNVFDKVDRTVVLGRCFRRGGDDPGVKPRAEAIINVRLFGEKNSRLMTELRSF